MNSAFPKTAARRSGLSKDYKKDIFSILAVGVDQSKNNVRLFCTMLFDGIFVKFFVFFASHTNTNVVDSYTRKDSSKDFRHMVVNKCVQSACLSKGVTHPW